MRLPCPWCGERDLSEFSYGGDATLRRPADDAPLEEWVDYVFFRDNPRGRHHEHWQHLQGCRAWIVIERLRDGTYVVDGAYYVVPASGLRGIGVRDVEGGQELTLPVPAGRGGSTVRYEVVW